MKHAAWFRLLLRVIGILLVALATPQVVSVVVRLLIVGRNRMRADPLDPAIQSELTNVLISLLYSVGTISQLALGLYLFFNPMWLMKVCIDDITYRCPACRYDLRGHTAPLACPECGVRLPGDVPPPTLTPAAGSQNTLGPGMIPTSREQPTGPSA